MKKLFLIFNFLIFSLTCFGQIGQYKIEVDGSRRQDCCARHECQNWYDIKAYFADNSSIWIANHITFAGDNITYSIDHDITYSANKDISHIYFFSERGNNRRCRNKPTGSRTVNVNNSCFFADFDLGDDLMGNGIFNEEAEIKIYPILTIVSPGINNFLPTSDEITINSHTGFDTSEYNWEYSFDLSNWVDMTSFNGSSSITLNAIDLLGNNATSHHGETIHIRQKACDYTSNEVSYVIAQSAPHISSIDETPVACFEDEKGSIKLNFDRALITDELLSISLTNTTTGLDYSVSNISNLETDNSYTVDNLPPGSYSARIIGAAPGYNGNMFNTYTDGATHMTTFVIEKPTPVEFTSSKIDVWCNGGSDGEISIQAKGGQLLGTYEYLLREVGDTTENWTPFSATGPLSGTFPNFYREEIISGLSPATYELKIRDSNGCIAKEIVRDGGGTIVGLSTEIIETIEITEPTEPVAITFVYHEEPTAFGFSDGGIRAQITGGTPLADDTYNYTWTHSNGTVWTTFTDVVDATDGYFLTLENAIAGTYKLTVTDANYTNATDKDGCTIVEAEFTLNEPPLLELSLAETNAISCNNTNTFNDPWSDGELTVTATGGVPFNPLIDGQHTYIYTWKKKDASGVYQKITGENSNVLSNIDTGDYAVNIEDANGIIIGTYANNILVTPTDELYTLNQPDLLKVMLSKIDVLCNGGNDGSIDATITGGTGNYTISWNTGATSEDIDTLVAGTYTIDVTDEKGCQAQATITIDEPIDPLEINYTFFAPTFTGATNGWIEATVTGGTPLNSGAYTYIWEDKSGTNLNGQVTETINTNSYVIQLNDLGCGVYNLTIEDANHPLAGNPTNCTIIDSAYELFEPEPLSASIELHTPISCNSTNTYGDPFSDGALEVIAEGGVQLQPTDNNGLPYYYTWKKETSPGVWTVLTTQTTNIAANLDAGNYAVNIEDANGIIIGVYVNNLLVNATDVTYLFEEPTLLELTIEKQDVYCYDGSDSWARAIIIGGTPPYDILWSNGDMTEQTSNLSQGIYDVAITDSRGCQVSGSIQINQPTEPLSINYTAFATPSTGGESDGWIEVQIAGGTDFADGSYTYYWQDQTGNLLNAQTTTSIVGGLFQIRLNDIPSGNYYLTIEDANFPLATTGDGCTILDDEFILYDPIEATISVNTPISCNASNVFNDPFSDGALQVVVTGGLPFSSGQPYIYYWKKENTGGTFDDLNQNSDIATGLSDGNYALNVEDSRGIVIGVYESLTLIQATDETFYFKEPQLLEVSLTKTDISCDAGNDATATVSIIGGIAPYDIQWSNGQSTTTATNLIAGNYVVYVTDTRGCQITGNITIDQPGGLMIDIIEQINPTCFEGNDGSIELALSGGVTPYTYSWNKGDITTTIDNLSEGTYTFTLMDANGCTAFKDIVLEHPNEIIIDLGEDRTLCQEQSHFLDGSISDPNATYSWTSDNGFSSANSQINVTESGIYTVIATSSLGCTVTDTVVISYNDTAINSEFLLASQAYVEDDVILFNVSSPLGDTSEWVIPNNVSIVSQGDTSITLRFPEANTYEIRLISTQGNCYQELYKNIVVEQPSGLPSTGDTETPFISAFIISPNPSNGQFEVHIELAENSPIALRIFDELGSFVFSPPKLSTSDEYTIPMSLSLAAGTYLVVLETAQETQIKRLITL